MTTVMISGWEYGFQKVNFTKLIKSALGFTLKPAKDITDRIVDGEQVELQVPDDQVEPLLAKTKSLGARGQALVSHPR